MLQDSYNDVIYSLYNQAKQQYSLLPFTNAIDKNNHHYQKLFQEWTNVDFVKFVEFFNAVTAKSWLSKSRSINIDSKIYLFNNNSHFVSNITEVKCIDSNKDDNCMTNMTIKWAFHETLFGIVLIAAIDKYLCALFFVENNNPKNSLRKLQKQWPMAKLEPDYVALEYFISILKSCLKGVTVKPLAIILKGTLFQIMTWKALLRIPEGIVLAYKDLAKLVGNPKACRAVGTAIGENPISYLIPCHRIIQTNGLFGNYHWGQERKRALLAIERARTLN